MPSRPAWRGQIRLALVSIPVEIYPATKSGAQIQFHQVHEPSGKRIKAVRPVSPREIEMIRAYLLAEGKHRDA